MDLRTRAQERGVLLNGQENDRELAKEAGQGKPSRERS
jgi:hypothetical protein